MNKIVDTEESIDILQEGLRDLNLQLGKELRVWRQGSGLSLREMARMLRCSAPFLADVETGRRALGPRTWERLESIAALRGRSEESDGFNKRFAVSDAVSKLQ